MSSVVAVKKSPKKGAKKIYTLTELKELISKELEIEYDAKIEKLSNELMLDLDALKKATTAEDITYNVDLCYLSIRTENYLTKVMEQEEK